jgi:hypothetical protein
MMKATFLVLFTFLSICLSAQEKLQEVRFSEQFKKEHQGKVKIEIDEVKELLHIMIALTSVGLENDDMIAQSGNYYQDLLQQFKKHKDDKIIIRFDSILKANPVNYIFLTGNALSYNFKGKKLVKDKVYIFPAQRVSSHTTISINPIETYKKEIEEFALKAGFRKFYKAHKSYYDTIISTYNKMANLQRQWDWLEEKFVTRVNNYTIMTSPLINGLNYTTSYTDNNFKQIMMVLPPVEENPAIAELDNIIFNTRVMFTEIDHNYVSQPTRQNKALIDEVCKNRIEWVDTSKYGTEYYPTPDRVFDEYMTYGLFLLYCSDIYGEDIAKKVKQELVQLMNERGFIKMDLFTDNLLRLYSANRLKKMDDWYPELISSFKE